MPLLRNDEADVKAAHQLQDAVNIEQADKGRFEVSDWKKDEVEDMRNKVMVVASTVSDASKMFGVKEEPDPVYWMLATAIGWGGLPAKAAMYAINVPEKNDGKTPYTLTGKDVPVDAFWSVTLYDDKGCNRRRIKRNRNASESAPLLASPNISAVRRQQ